MSPCFVATLLMSAVHCKTFVKSEIGKSRHSLWLHWRGRSWIRNGRKH